jgi:hypothetical protein
VTARLGEILVSMKVCTRGQIEWSLRNQAMLGGRLGTHLIETGAITEEQLARGLARHHQAPCLFGDLEPEQAALRLFTVDQAERWQAVPYLMEDEALAVLVCDPNDRKGFEQMASATGKKIRPVIVPETRHRLLMQRCYGLRGEARRAAADLTAPAAEPIVPDLLDFKQALRLLSAARDRPAMARILLRYARSKLQRAIVLRVKGGVASGWEGFGPGLDASAVGQIRVKLGESSAIDTVVATRAHFLGPLQKSQANIRFLKALAGGAPRNSLLIPIVAQGRVESVLYADNGRGGTIHSDIGELLILVAKVSQRNESPPAR